MWQLLSSSSSLILEPPRPETRIVTCEFTLQSQRMLYQSKKTPQTNKKQKIESTKSGGKFGLTHLQFTCKLFDSTFVLVIHDYVIISGVFLVRRSKQPFDWADSTSDESPTLLKTNATGVCSRKCTELFRYSVCLQTVCCITKKKHLQPNRIYSLLILTLKLRKINLLFEWPFSAPTFCSLYTIFALLLV